jgi:hypothetical protein
MKLFGAALFAAAYLAAGVPGSAMAQSSATHKPAAAPPAPLPPKVEFIDLRWDGVDHMCVVFPDGHIDFVGKELKAIPRPDDVDRRAFYMTIELNRLTAQGYEFVAMISDEIIMKRVVR